MSMRYLTLNLTKRILRLRKATSSLAPSQSEFLPDKPPVTRYGMYITGYFFLATSQTVLLETKALQWEVMLFYWSAMGDEANYF